MVVGVDEQFRRALVVCAHELGVRLGVQQSARPRHAEQLVDFAPRSEVRSTLRAEAPETYVSHVVEASAESARTLASAPPSRVQFS